MIYKSLGVRGPQVSAIGLGCMGLSGHYEQDLSDNESIKLIQKAFELGITFFDTADIYGAGHNEKLLGNAFKSILNENRNQVVIATKCGLDPQDFSVNLDYKYIIEACTNSLARLNIDYIDLYYLHRTSSDLGKFKRALDALTKLLENNLIRYIGLSEASVDTINFTYEYFDKLDLLNHFIAVQSEFSLFTQNVKYNEVLRTCNELGLAFVAYSPLSRALLSTKEKMHSDFAFQDGDFRGLLPRFQGDNFKANLEIRDSLERIAINKNCSVPQLALSWLIAQEGSIFPIPGTRKITNLINNINTLSVKLNQEDLEQINKIMEQQVMGQRYTEEMVQKQGIIE